MNRYFKDVKTSEQLKKLYFDLAKRYHPDRPGGNLVIMQEVNAEYMKVFSAVKDQHLNKEGEIYTSKVKSSELPDDYINIISVIFSSKLEIEVELCGRWLYIRGDTKPLKESLKKEKAFWSPTKGCWIWHPKDSYRRPHQSWGMDEIRNCYGSAIVENDEKICLETRQ